MNEEWFKIKNFLNLTTFDLIDLILKFHINKLTNIISRTKILII